MVINPLKFVRETDWSVRSNNIVITHEAVENKIDKFDTYQFQGRGVPRVSEILKKCLGKDYLVTWAARLGLEEYRKESNRTLYIGSIVHECIEYFLIHGEIKIPDNISSPSVRNKIRRAVENFVDWYNSMVSKGYIIRIIAIEQQTTNPWFGGTIDCIMNISNPNIKYSKNFIVDFKTSKSISIDYILQTYAYLWSVRWNKQFYDPTLPNIDGIGIIRIDKEAVKFEDLFLSTTEHTDIMVDLGYTLNSMISWYYHILITEYNLKLGKRMKERLL